MNALTVSKVKPYTEKVFTEEEKLLHQEILDEIKIDNPGFKYFNLDDERIKKYLAQWFVDGLETIDGYHSQVKVQDEDEFTHILYEMDKSFEFEKAIDKANFKYSDRLFLKIIKQTDIFERTVQLEEKIQAFNIFLQLQSKTAKFFYRNVGMAELNKYLKPNVGFGQSKDGIGPASKYKCLSLSSTGYFFNDYDVFIRYPADQIRKGSKTARYTLFPREHDRSDLPNGADVIQSADYVYESEVRIKSTVKIPIGDLHITFRDHLSRKEKSEIKQKYKSLGKLVFKERVEYTRK